jgi:hypothetical protein
MKNGARKPRSSLIQKYFLTCSHNVRGAQNFLCLKVSLKLIVWPGEVYRVIIFE